MLRPKAGGLTGYLFIDRQGVKIGTVKQQVAVFFLEAGLVCFRGWIKTSVRVMTEVKPVMMP